MPGTWGEMSGEAIDGDDSSSNGAIGMTLKQHGGEEEALPSESSSGCGWGTCAELLLVSAVKKHGLSNWNLVALELQARALLLDTPPSCFSKEACIYKFNSLKRKFAESSSDGSSDVNDDNHSDDVSWFKELRKLRISHLKKELKVYDSSIGELQSRINRLQEERPKCPLLQPAVESFSSGSMSHNANLTVSSRWPDEHSKKFPGSKPALQPETAPPQLLVDVSGNRHSPGPVEVGHGVAESALVTSMVELTVKDDAMEDETTTSDMPAAKKARTEFVIVMEETADKPDGQVSIDKELEVLSHAIEDDEISRQQSLDRVLWAPILESTTIAKVSGSSKGDDNLIPIVVTTSRDDVANLSKLDGSIGQERMAVEKLSKADTIQEIEAPPLGSTEANQCVDFPKGHLSETEPNRATDGETISSGRDDLESVFQRERRLSRLSLSYRRAQKDKRLKEVKVQPTSRFEALETVAEQSSKRIVKNPEVLTVEAEEKMSNEPSSVVVKHDENAIIPGDDPTSDQTETKLDIASDPSRALVGNGPDNNVLEPTRLREENMSMCTDFPPSDKSEMYGMLENTVSVSGKESKPCSPVPRSEIGCDSPNSETNELNSQLTIEAPSLNVTSELASPDDEQPVVLAEPLASESTGEADLPKEVACKSAAVVEETEPPKSEARLVVPDKELTGKNIASPEQEVEAERKLEESGKFDEKVGAQMPEADVATSMAFGDDVTDVAELKLEESDKLDEKVGAQMPEADVATSMAFGDDVTDVAGTKGSTRAQEEEGGDGMDGLENGQGQQPFLDCTDNQVDKSEVGSSMDSIEDTSPSSRKNRKEPKVLGKLQPLFECLRVICAHEFAPLFRQRREYQDTAEYDRLVRRHVDLGMVRARLEEGAYSGSEEFFRDLLLIFTNALVYNSSDSQEFAGAKALRTCALTEMDKILQTEALLKQNGPATRKREGKRPVEVKKPTEVAQKGDAKKSMEVHRSRVSSTSGSKGRKQGMLKGQQQETPAALDPQAGARSGRIAFEDTPLSGRSSNKNKEHRELDSRINESSKKVTITSQRAAKEKDKDETPLRKELRKELHESEFRSDVKKGGSAQVSGKKAKSKADESDEKVKPKAEVSVQKVKAKVEESIQKVKSKADENVQKVKKKSLGAGQTGRGASGGRQKVEKVGAKAAPSAKVKDALYIGVERKRSLNSASGGVTLRLAAGKQQQADPISRQTSTSRVSRYSKRERESTSSKPQKKRVRK